MTQDLKIGALLIVESVEGFLQKLIKIPKQFSQ